MPAATRPAQVQIPSASSSSLTPATLLNPETDSMAGQYDQGLTEPRR